MKVWEEGESVRVFQQLLGKSLEELNEIFWLHDEFCDYDNRSEAMMQAHAMLYEIELFENWVDIGE